MNKFAKRLRVYFVINTFVVAIAVQSFLLVSWGQQTSSLIVEAGSIYVSRVIRMVATVLQFEALTMSGVPRINKDKDSLKELSIWGPLKGLFLIAGLLEVVNMMYATRYPGLFLPTTADCSYFWEYITFIPKSFVLEIMLDFFHYWAHRYFHKNKFMFRLVHAEHHLHTHPSALSSYSQTYMEVILTNMIPLFIAYRFGPTLTIWQLHLFMSYKTFIEVGGHSGLDINAPSFPQCPLIGWFTDNIALDIQDHDWHHNKPTKNFSKRFSLWDHMFGTYEKPNPRRTADRQYFKTTLDARQKDHSHNNENKTNKPYHMLMKSRVLEDQKLMKSPTRRIIARSA